MQVDAIKIGLVIPIYLTKFVKQAVENILEKNNREDLVLCIVNDGKEDTKEYLSQHEWAENVDIVNLPENRCFSGANNAGWKYLVKTYPNIEYLGSVNDDVISQTGWLDNIITSLEKHPKTALGMPIMETNQGFLHTKKNFATWRLKGSDEMVPIAHKIKEDTFVSAVNGFCFVVRKEVLLQAGMLDEQFKNGCEDVDLGIKILLGGWRMIVSKESFVFHFGGSSRYLPGTNTNLDLNHKILAEKWDHNIEKFNNLDENGFLIQ